LREAGFELVIIDTPPAITNAITKMVKLADLVLIPTRPSPHDLRAVGSTVSIALDENKPFIFVVTQAKSNAKLTTQAMAALSEHGMVSSTIIHDRVEYASSMINGETVVEINKKGRSTEEINQLLNLVLERMNVITKKRNKKAI
jgi:chromosome partitioning protein